MSILTPIEAATVLRCESDDENMLDLLGLVDAYIENATGWKWAADGVINLSAKAAARMLLVQWHENPSQMSEGLNSTALAFGLDSVLLQLKAEATRLKELVS